MSAPSDIQSSEAGQRSSGTSRSLLDRVRADDAEGWERLVGLYAPLVLHWCRRLGLREPDTADVFQEVFQSVALHIASFKKTRAGGTFRGWLRRITHNKAYDLFRRRGHQPEGVGGTDALRRLDSVPDPELLSDESSVEEQTAQTQLVRRVIEVIRSEFAERTWQAFWRTAIDGQPTREAAEALGMSPGAVRVARSRVLHRLRTELGDLPG